MNAGPENDDDLEAPDDVEAPEVDADAEDEEDTFEPPTKAEFNKLQRDLKRANAQAKKLKDAARSAPSDDDKESLKSEGFSEAEGKYKPLLVRAEARAQLAIMGLKGKPDRLLKLLDLDDIEVDEDGDIEGLEDQLATIREEWPDMFDARKLKGDKRTRADASDRAPGDVRKSTAELLADQALGRR